MKTVESRIGVPREVRPFETRIAIVPDHSRHLTQKGHRVMVEEDAGAKSGFTNESYESAGAEIVDSVTVYDASTVVRVKRPVIGTIGMQQTLAGSFLGADTGQDPEMLDTLLSQKNTAMAYHRVLDFEGNRLVTQSAEAGIVGVYEGLRLYGGLQVGEHAYAHLPSSWDLGNRKRILGSLKGAEIDSTPSIYILGNGVASGGAQELLRDAGLPFTVLGRTETSHIEEYLPDADIVVNTVSWKPGDSPVITRDMLRLIQPSTPIVDVTCVTEGSIETTQEQTWDNPVYQVDGVTHFTVGNLPSAIGNDASRQLSNSLRPYIDDLARGEIVSGTFIHKGRLLD